MSERKAKIKSAAKWTGGLGSAGSVLALAALDPDRAVAMAEDALKSNYGPVMAAAVLAWHLFLKPLLSHLISIQAELKRLGDVVEDGFRATDEQFKAGDERMSKIESRLDKGGL